VQHLDERPVRRFEAKTLARTAVENQFHASDLYRGYVSKIGLLRVEAPDQTVGVFYGAFFPAVERQAEKGPGSQDLIDQEMFDVLRAVVIGDCPTEAFGKLTKAAIDGLARVRCGFLGQPGEFHEAAFSFDHDQNRGFTLPGNDGVHLPVAVLIPCLDDGGPLGDWNALWDMAFAVIVGMPSAEPFSMRTSQEGNEVPGFAIYELVDGLMGNRNLGFLLVKLTGYLFG